MSKIRMGLGNVIEELSELARRRKSWRVRLGLGSRWTVVQEMRYVYLKRMCNEAMLVSYSDFGSALDSLTAEEREQILAGDNPDWSAARLNIIGFPPRNDRQQEATA